MLSLVQEQDKPDSPLILIMLGGADGFTPWNPLSRPWKAQTSPRWLATSCCVVLPWPMAPGRDNLAGMGAVHRPETSSKGNPTQPPSHQPVLPWFERRQEGYCSYGK
jgi:hypothetical protein